MIKVNNLQLKNKKQITYSSINIRNKKKVDRIL